MRFVDVLSYFSILSSGEKLIICYFVPHHFQESDNGKLELVNRNVLRSGKLLDESYHSIHGGHCDDSSHLFI